MIYYSTTTDNSMCIGCVYNIGPYLRCPKTNTLEYNKTNCDSFAFGSTSDSSKGHRGEDK